MRKEDTVVTSLYCTNVIELPTHALIGIPLCQHRKKRHLNLPTRKLLELSYRLPYLGVAFAGESLFGELTWIEPWASGTKEHKYCLVLWFSPLWLHIPPPHPLRDACNHEKETPPVLANSLLPAVRLSPQKRFRNIFYNLRFIRIRLFQMPVCTW